MPPRRLLWPHTWMGRLALGLVLIGLWVGTAIPVAVFIDMPASGLQRSNQGLRDLALAELSLRAAGLRRYAEANGKLPATLAECGSFCPSFRALMEQELVLSPVAELIREPWAPRDDRGRLLPVPAETGLPGAGEDVFGLPVLLTKGRELPGQASVTSSERLPEEVTSYLDAIGSKPPASPEPFTLTSVFLREHARQIRHQLDAAHLQVACILLSCPLFVVAIVWWIVRARHNRGGSRLAGALSAVVSLATVVFSLGTTMVTCYMPSPARTSRVSRADRLAYLERAVARGDVPANVAQAARVYLERLPP